MMRNKYSFILILVVFIYCLFIIFDIPFIRGIYDPIFPSEWPYYYVNTWNKLWFPILALICTCVCFWIGYSRYDHWKGRGRLAYWFVLIFFVFTLHLSYVYFSRFGITVLFQRIVNPGMNGYFSSAVRLDTLDYLRNFPDVIENLDQHARDHPPGSILFIKGVMYFFEKSPIASIVVNAIPTPDGDVRQYWDKLSNAQRVGAVFLAFFYHFAGAISVILIYFIGKLFFSSRISLSLALLTGFIPSISFFALKFDPFYFLLFGITSYFFLRAIKKSPVHFFYAGIGISLCLVFSYSLVPAIGVLLIYFVLLFWRERRVLFDGVINMTIGFLVPVLVLLLVGYNSFSAFFPIISNQAPRAYWQWAVYNPFDFFQYFGVAISVLFFIVVINLKKFSTQNDMRRLTAIFISVFLVLVISGISRAEVGRIWMPLMLFPLLSLGLYKRLTMGLVIGLALLLFIQNIVMTEYWVPIW